MTDKVINTAPPKSEQTADDNVDMSIPEFQWQQMFDGISTQLSAFEKGEKYINSWSSLREKKDEISDFGTVIALAAIREQALHHAVVRLKKYNLGVEDEDLVKLAATDLFVEKAQGVLTGRSEEMVYWGRWASFVAMGLLFSSIAFVGTITILGLVGLISVPTNISVNDLILRIFQATAFSAFVLVSVKVLIAYSRSCFHESISLLERRHALRYGRLYVYLKKGKLTDKGLEKAFQWNKATSSSFLDIKPNELAETILHKPFETVVKMATKMAKTAKKNSKQVNR